MIKTITVTNYLGESIVLDLSHPERSGIFVARIEGLGPPKANINIADLSTDDGGSYNSARLETRNITMTLGFMFEPSIEEVRLKTYKYFPIKKKVKLAITTDTRTSEIYGYVETNEPEVFSPQSFTSISIICPDPYFYATDIETTVFSGIEPMFEFPFENPSLADNLIEMSSIRIEQARTVYYTGDAEVGVQIHIHATGPATNVSIFNVDSREQMHIDSAKLIAMTGSDIVNGDDILITTTKTSKSVTLLREGRYYDILTCLNRNANWFKLAKGDNVFLYTVDSGDTNLQFRITNSIAYEGV